MLLNDSSEWHHMDGPVAKILENFQRGAQFSQNFIFFCTNICKNSNFANCRPFKTRLRASNKSQDCKLAIFMHALYKFAIL